jgi:G:T-mismatch repair DNA endonuclease (very short patch repair protein)
MSRRRVPRELRKCRNPECNKSFSIRPKETRRTCNRECYVKWQKSAENRRIQAEATRKVWEDPEYKKRMLVVRKEQWTPERKKSQSVKMLEVMQNVVISPEGKQKQLEAQKRRWDKPGEREKASNRLAERNRNNWADPKYREKRIRQLKEMWSGMTEDEKTARLFNLFSASRRIRGKNKFETKVEEYLSSLFPSGFEYSGSTRLIGRRCPDFMHSSNKLVVLCHGAYWHLTIASLSDTPKNRKAVLLSDAKPYIDKGYSVMIIWDDGLVVFYLVGEVAEYSNVVSELACKNLFTGQSTLADAC